MPYNIAIFDWSLYTLPSTIPTANIEGDTHSNHPDSEDYYATEPTWIGETFTYNGGAASNIFINDDDGDFEDEYVETGGAQTLSQDVTINGTTFLAGSVVENEFSMLDDAGNEIFVVRIDGINVGFGYPVGQDPVAGESFTGTVGRDGAAHDSSDGLSSTSEPYASVTCFAQGTLIKTPNGQRPVEALKIGDKVITLDHGAQPIRWTRRSLNDLSGASTSDAPVLIKAGALGQNHPAQDLIVSPQHRILVGGIGQLQSFFPTQAFAPAKSLVTLPGIRHMRGKQSITWVHFACAQHEIVTANGCLTESLLLGAMVINQMPTSELKTVIEIFGRPVTQGAALNGPPARACLAVGKVRKILETHPKGRETAVAKDIQRWDVDRAMEQYEADLMRELSSEPPAKNIA